LTVLQHVFNDLLMPLYEYLCPSCKTRTEKLMKVSEFKPKIRCPKCGKQAPKAISAFAVAGLSKGGDDDFGDFDMDGMGGFGGDDDFGGGGFDDFDD